MAKNHIIEIQNLSKSFGNHKVLEDVSFYIRKGEFITLLGPSGCGKTTLLKILGGFCKQDEGTVFMDGQDISNTPPHLRELNTVFQRYALFPHLDVYDNIAFGLRMHSVDEKEIDKRVKKMLKMVSMTDYEDRDIDSLSGGQQQRIAIARALVNYPKILLLDEPLSALDAKMRKDMQVELKELHKKMGITFIFVTHDQEEALAMSDTIVVMNEGKIQQIGTPADIYNEPVNEFVADFIGESNILDGVMLEDRRVSFIGKEFECVDEGFGENVPVDVVLRPEDIYIMNQLNGAQFSGKVTSCTFKGVFYDITVEAEGRYELLIQDYNPFEVGSEVGMLIKPADIQVMHKSCTQNVIEAYVLDAGHIELLGEEIELAAPLKDFEKDAPVKVGVAFKAIDLQDHLDEGLTGGVIENILYKGDHYHLKIRTDDGVKLFADTNDIWDKGDLVGIKINPKDVKIIEERL